MRQIFLTSALTLALGSAAFAQELTTGHVTALDGDGDGSVSAAELSAFMSSAFARIDADGNGGLTMVESGALLPSDTFATADTDGNGEISVAEFSARISADFAAADQDRDGVLN